MIHQSLAWWLVIEGLGLVALPVTLTVFGRLPGRGYAFAKPFGIILGAYLFWLALTLHLLPNRPGSIVWAFLPIAIASSVILYRRRDELIEAVQERLGFIIALEVVFTLVFAVAVYLRSFIPEIAGTEKPMDFMFLNAAARSRYYPPDDAWLSGFHVSYYYFGYVIQAMIAKLAAVQTSVAFNLGLASTCALAASAAFGLGYEIVRIARRVTFRTAILTGVAAAVLLVVMGNLEGVIEFGVANDNVLPQSVVNRVDIANLDTAQQSHACIISLPNHCLEYPNEQSSFWWWWRATRISPDGNSITEFPFFSFLLGDMHPHVMALPYVLTSLALALAFWRSGERLDRAFWQRRPALLFAAAVAIGALAFLNTWDLPTFGFIVVLLVVARNWVAGFDEVRTLNERKSTEDQKGGSRAAPTSDIAAGAGAAREPPSAPTTATMPTTAAVAALVGPTPRVRIGWVLSDSGSFLLPLGVLALMLYAPFFVSFSSQASGLAAVTNGATRPIHSALFWLPLVAVSLPLPIVLLARDRRVEVQRRLLCVALLPAALLLIWVGVAVLDVVPGSLGAAITSRGWNWLTVLFYATAVVVALTALWRTIETERDDASLLVPVLALMATAFLLILGAELFYIRDIFGTRLNTVFKLSYQAWLLLAVSGAASLYWLLREWQPAPRSMGLVLRRSWSAVAALVLAGALLYPLGATLSRTNGLSNPNRTLDGLSFARQESPDDFAALTWLSTRADNGERVIEATGGQYSSYGRVSAWTGIPTILGWAGHETQWGRDGKLLSQRTADIDTVYGSDSLADSLAILRKYDVTYVFVGTLERAKYPPEALQKFEAGLQPAFRAGDSTIYRVPIFLDQPQPSGRAP